jgi:hypothetical protein
MGPQIFPPGRMRSVRKPPGPAWVPSGRYSGAMNSAFLDVHHKLLQGSSPMSDLLFIGVTIVVFAVLILIVKGIERFER